MPDNPTDPEAAALLDGLLVDHVLKRGTRRTSILYDKSAGDAVAYILRARAEHPNLKISDLLTAELGKRGLFV